jgi:hypothetical protein
MPADELKRKTRAYSPILRHFDQKDFLCRQDVTDAYLEEWFHDGLVDWGRLAISRFHRCPSSMEGRSSSVVVTGPPCCFPTANAYRSRSRCAMRDARYQRRGLELDTSALSPIEADTLIELPDLPIRPSLP